MSKSKTKTYVKEEEESSSTFEEETQGGAKPKKAAGYFSGDWGWGYASMYLWFIVAPIVIWIILFTCKPSFVSDQVNGVCVLNNQKLLLWTLIFSIVAWILIYAVYYCRY
jgi:hypothetical protein